MKDEELDDKISAYAAGLLFGEELKEFEKAMQADPSIAREVQLAKGMERRLDKLVPLMDRTDDELVDLLAREHEKATHRLERSTEMSFEQSREPISLLNYIWNAMPRLALVAACLMVAVGVVSRTTGPMQWIVRDASLVRGDESGHLTSGELARVRDIAQKALAKAFSDTAVPAERSILFGTKSPWRWSVSASPTADNALLMQVAIFGKGQTQPQREWEQVFPTPADFEAKVSVWATKIVDESRQETTTSP